MTIVAANGRTYGTFYTQDLLRDDQGRVVVIRASGLPELTPTAVYLGTYNPDYLASWVLTLPTKASAWVFYSIQSKVVTSIPVQKTSWTFVGAAAETAEGDRAGYVFPNSVYLDETGKYVAEYNGDV
jgi:hypothetical protein